MNESVSDGSQFDIEELTDPALTPDDSGTVESGNSQVIDLDSRLSDAELVSLLNAFADRVRTESAASQLLATAGDFSDLRHIEGEDKSYWYSSKTMTDNYANWAMLADEDDVAHTLISCAREESKVYPRPMIISSLGNAPFFINPTTVEDAFTRINESGQFPDIQRLEASNGDVYFYSTDSLSTPQAKALAEYYSVEIYINV